MISELPVNFAIIGAGGIGHKRAIAIRELGYSVVGVADIDRARASSLASEVGANVNTDVTSLLADSSVHVVIVATTNGALASVSEQCLLQGKHVLVEKPAGRNPGEVSRLREIASGSKPICRVGFNHRFHEGLLRAKELLDKGAIGTPMYIRAHYGHGGRIGYDKEWRADPTLSGGGELLDQGVHLIDLSRWYLGEMDLEFGLAETFFWKMPVEDNGFVLLKSSDSAKRAWLHASCTEWKNTFDFEIFGDRGKLQVTGLGKSYGPEELKFFRVKPEMGVPVLETTVFPEDTSWKKEIAALVDEIRGVQTPIATLRDAERAASIVYGVYRLNRI